MMYVALTAALQHRERLGLGSHEREYGLLPVTEIHHRQWTVASQFVDYGELKTVEVLHLIHLNPRITLVFPVAVCPQRVVCHHKKVLEIEKSVGTLILFILSRERHLAQQGGYHGSRAVIVSVAVGGVAIERGVVIYIGHSLCIERHSLHFAYLAQRAYVLHPETLGMYAQAFGVSVSYLMH